MLDLFIACTIRNSNNTLIISQSIVGSQNKLIHKTNYSHPTCTKLKRI